MLKWISDALYQFGLFGAGVARLHGSFDAEVPTCLSEHHDQ